MNEIKINGVILNGKLKNWNIFIEDLDKGEGAYLILLSSPDHLQAYDDWVENYTRLEGYLKEAKWEIEWLK